MYITLKNCHSLIYLIVNVVLLKMWTSDFLKIILHYYIFNFTLKPYITAHILTQTILH